MKGKDTPFLAFFATETTPTVRAWEQMLQDIPRSPGHSGEMKMTMFVRKGTSKQAAGISGRLFCFLLSHP